MAAVATTASADAWWHFQALAQLTGGNFYYTGPAPVPGGEWGDGGVYSYEALNFVDGKRTARQIAAELSAEFGVIPTDMVLEYLQDLRKIGVLQ